MKRRNRRDTSHSIVPWDSVGESDADGVEVDQIPKAQAKGQRRNRGHELGLRWLIQTQLSLISTTPIEAYH